MTASALAAGATQGEPGVPRLIGLGLLAAALFSCTFVLNRAISLAGGPWVWNAVLRYIDMAVLMSAWIAWRSGVPKLVAVLRLFVRHPGTWLPAGGIGFGVFYACICFAGDHAPAWVLSGTWNVTIVATPIVLRGFGQRVPARGIAFGVVIVLGVVLLNVRQLALGVPPRQIMLGVVPIVIAAFAYPFGSQILNRARHAPGGGVVLADPAAGVLLLTLGSLPVFAALVAVLRPPAPAPSQVAGVLLVAVISGCVATTLFLRARNLSADPYRIAAVDATQSGEVLFALTGEMLLLGAPPPGLTGWLGLAALVAGLVGFSLPPIRRRRGRLNA